MPIPHNEADASLYKLLHQSVPLGRPPADVPVNRRNRPRRPFHSVQRIAPRRGSCIPSETEFFEVPCYDLTGQGFSFLLPAWPDFNSLVAVFNLPPETVRVAADVVRCTRVLVYPPDPGQPLGSWSLRRGDRIATESGLSRILLGCRFTERL
jgi:hypothetical protein